MILNLDFEKRKIILFFTTRERQTETTERRKQEEKKETKKEKNEFIHTSKDLKWNLCKNTTALFFDIEHEVIVTVELNMKSPPP